MSARVALALALAAGISAGWPGARAASNAAGGLDFADQGSGAPVEVYADEGLELSQDSKTVTAHGNAKAIRGRVTVTADTIVSHYRPKKPQPGQQVQAAKAAPADTVAAATAKPGAAGDTTGGSEIWRVEADGHVVIFTATQRAYGDHADYNIDDAVVVLTGSNLHMTTPTDLVTARDSLEYWEHTQQAVARGNAVAVRGDKRLRGDILVADFERNKQQQMAMRFAHAYQHVVLTTPTEVVTGDRGDYDAETGIVTVTGSVKMTRGNNQLDGGYAVVNLDTGISKLFPAPPGAAAGADSRVKGLFVPERNEGAGSSGQPPPPPPQAQP